MTIDLKGTALVIGAIFTGVPAVATAYLQIRAARLAEKNKNESIAARANLESKVDTIAGHVSDIAAASTTPPTPGGPS